MRLLGNLFQVNGFVELHILGVNAQHFETTDFIRNTNIDLAIEAAESTKSWVDRIRSVRRAHDDDVRS